MNPDQYLLFKEKCIEDLCSLQEEFNKLYDLQNTLNWNYDHGIGIFTLKYKDHSIYFEYVFAGTYSNNSHSWKWSWDNEHIPHNVKNGMERIRAYGIKNQFDDMSAGLINGEKEVGWEMTAIANKLIKGFGSYKVQSDHLDMYFLFTREVEEETYKKLKERYITCGEHGSRRRAFVCQHLNQNTRTGFEEAFPTSPDMEFEYEDDDFQAWCDECEKVRVEQDGWNDESQKFADIKLICEKCYFEIKEFNLGYKEG